MSTHTRTRHPIIGGLSKKILKKFMNANFILVLRCQSHDNNCVSIIGWSDDPQSYRITNNNIENLIFPLDVICTEFQFGSVIISECVIVACD